MVRSFREDPKIAVNRLRGYFRDPLFIYQMGKVGSRTISNTLEPYYYVRHSHVGAEYAKQRAALKIKQGEGYKGAPLNIISIVREPIAREISAFFQNFTVVGHPYYLADESDIVKYTADELIDIFLDKISQRVGVTLNWFENNFEPVTDIDIYENDFDSQKGWSLNSSDTYRVLLLRFEDINKNHVEALNALLKVRREGALNIDQLHSMNLSTNKWYGSLLKEFKSKISFPDDVLETVYSSKYCKYFYSDAECQAFQERWK